MASGIVFCAVLAAAGIAFALPHSAGAFWPLSISKANGQEVPLLHDSSLRLLSAPINSDPGSNFGTSTPLTTDDGSALLASDTFPDASSTPADAPDSISVPSNGSISQYIVQPGDSLSVIAEKNGVSVNTILWANDIKNPGSITTGTKLVILPVSGIEHTVRKGETLSSIAQKFGGDADDIAQFNGLSSGSALAAGTTLIIPGGELGATSDTATPSKTTTTTTTKSTTKTGTKSTTSVTVKTSGSTGSINYSNETGNPYKGGSGSALMGFFTNPLPGALLTQGIHGWNAVDLGAPSGTTIRAAAAGTVLLSRMSGWNGGYGNYVIIDNGHGIETLYAHMTRTGVSVGDTVSAGEAIGTVGTTGDATGPHLHFEVRGAENPFAHCTEMKVCAPE